MYNIYPESSYELQDSTDIITYISGGKGILTLTSPTGKYHTYAFNKPRYPNDFPDGTLFIYSQVASGVWLYCGMVDSDFTFRLTRFSTWDNDCEIVKGIRFIMRMIHNQPYNKSMKLYHAGVCSVCGKKLTNPKSIIKGLGPKCRKRLLNHELSSR